MIINHCVFNDGINPVINVFGQAKTGLISKIKVINADNFEDYIFLCRSNDNVFVSRISYDDSFGYYVDDIKRKQVIRVNDLNELNLIKVL